MHIDTPTFLEMLRIDSTSGSEREMARYMLDLLSRMDCRVELQGANAATSDGPVNVHAVWGDGTPLVTFCTHLDTVPPYIPPTPVYDDEGRIVEVRGRGACDAKGQIMAMLTACRELQRRGESGFALLLLHGEETGSYGAKEFRTEPGGPYVVVGEPTDNRQVTASKGTKAFGVTIHGRAAHSGYPELGISAIDRFVDFANRLRAADLPVDPVLGPTTYNIGRLISDNPQNILSPRLSCRVYFRTTFATDSLIGQLMQSLATEGIDIEAYGGDTPMRYLTVPDIDTTTVAFGSDAPQLTNYRHKSLIGPGSILVAHTDREQITIEQLNKAALNYINIFYRLQNLSANIDANI